MSLCHTETLSNGYISCARDNMKMSCGWLPLQRLTGCLSFYALQAQPPDLWFPLMSPTFFFGFLKAPITHHTLPAQRRNVKSQVFPSGFQRWRRVKRKWTETPLRLSSLINFKQLWANKLVPQLGCMFKTLGQFWFCGGSEHSKVKKSGVCLWTESLCYRETTTINRSTMYCTMWTQTNLPNRDKDNLKFAWNSRQASVRKMRTLHHSSIKFH